MKNLYLLPTDKPSSLCINAKTVNHIYITSDEEIKEGDYFIESLGLPDSYLVHKLSKEWKDKESFYRRCTKVILTTDQDLDGVQAIDDDFLEWFVKNPSCESVEVEIETTSIQLPQQQLSENSYDLAFRWINKKVYKIIIPKEEPKQETHICKYCNAETTQSDDECYAKPKTLEEPKQFVECKCTNSLQAENCIRNCGHGQEPCDNCGNEICCCILKKQETLEELAKDFYSDENQLMERIAFKRGYTECKENSYSEEEVLELILKSKIETSNLYYEDMKEWFEQFKKK